MSISKQPTLERGAKALATGSASAATTALVHAIPFLAPYAPVLNGLSSVAAEWLTELAVRSITEQRASERIFSHAPSITVIQGALSVSSLTEILRATRLAKKEYAQLYFGIKYGPPNMYSVHRDNLCKIIKENWEFDTSLIRKAAALLAGVSQLAGGLGEFEHDLRNKVISKLKFPDTFYIGVCESLCFVFGISQDVEVYHLLMRKTIGNMLWRSNETMSDVLYCGEIDDALVCRMSHLEQRKDLGLTSSHDAGRSVHLLTSLPKEFRATSYGQQLEAMTLSSLHWDPKAVELAKYELAKKH